MTHELGFETSVDAHTKPTKSKYKTKYNIIKRIVSTLDPLHLQSSDFMDISNAVQPTLTLPGIERPGVGLRIVLYYYGGKGQPFPDNTRGFFYYCRPPGLPFAASGLRFRVTSGMDPSSANFDAGEDLLLPLGVPWQVSFPNIVISSTTTDLRNYLLRCGAITQSQLDTCRQQFKGLLPAAYYTLYTLSQPFPVSFNTYTIRFCVVGPDRIIRFNISNMFSDKRRRSDGTRVGPPYRGSGIAQLQASTRPEHAGQNVLAMNILKIIQPVTCTIPEYDGYMPPPEEGSVLYRRSAPRGSLSRLWVHEFDLK
ncbi:hypothetical protein BD779DRAFT_1680047 [Infundibulicybe gibba]|nr:hypothetical protein BD779DRAFT_1680047 [Infundibulicybe gibba]